MNRSGTHFMLDYIRLLIVVFVSTIVVHSLHAQDSTGDSWQAGREFRIDDPAAGTDGYYLVYVPADYDPAEKWPVVFYYHGLGGRPNTSTIRRIANEKYCIVAGMSYYAPGMEGYRFLDTEDIRIFHHVLASIRKRLNVNDKKIYIGGFSKGGFYTCEMLRRLSDELAGAIVLGAGGKLLDADWPRLAGKEVFMGCGQKDQFITTAKPTCKHLEKLGATVTFEEWPDTAHAIGDIAGIRRWIFEQTVDRPRVDTKTKNVDNSSGTATPSMVAQNDPKTSDFPWIVIAVILAAFVMLGIVLVIRRRRSHSPLSGKAESKDKNL